MGQTSFFIQIYHLTYLLFVSLMLVGCSNSGSDTNPSTSISVTEIENDTIPKSSKEWEWGCDSDTSCMFRSSVNQESTHTFSESDGYTLETTITEEIGDRDEGVYYLHVQAKDLSGNESDVKTASFILQLSRSPISAISLVLIDPAPQTGSSPFYRNRTPTIEVSRKERGEMLESGQKIQFYNSADCNSLNVISDTIALIGQSSIRLTTDYLHPGIYNIYAGVRTESSLKCSSESLMYVVYNPVVIGHKFSCHLAKTGSVKCWGMNDKGQLGQGNSNESGKGAIGDASGEMGDQLPEVDLGTDRRARFITAGSHHVCAILDDNSVKCWGKNDVGQLGQGNSNESGKDAIGDAFGEMGDGLDPIDLGDGRTVKTIAAGGDYTCAVLDNNSLKCWGKNDEHQLGLALNTETYGDDEDEMGDNLLRVDLGNGRIAKAVATGNHRACAILNNDSVKCWGRRSFSDIGSNENQLSQTTDPNVGRPYSVDLGDNHTAKTITVGNGHTCVILDNNGMKCWGLNDKGQLGLGDTENRGDDLNEMGNNLPNLDLGLNHIASAITTGDNHTCAILTLVDEDSVKCWGENNKGQLGLGDLRNRGDETNETVDNLSKVDLGLNLIIKTVMAGNEHTCAVLNDASSDDDIVKCWGSNDKGQLGLGDTKNRGGLPDEVRDRLPEIEL